MGLHPAFSSYCSTIARCSPSFWTEPSLPFCLVVLFCPNPHSFSSVLADMGALPSGSAKYLFVLKIVNEVIFYRMLDRYLQLLFSLSFPISSIYLFSFFSHFSYRAITPEIQLAGVPSAVSSIAGLGRVHQRNGFCARDCQKIKKNLTACLTLLSCIIYSPFPNLHSFTMSFHPTFVLNQQCQNTNVNSKY